LRVNSNIMTLSVPRVSGGNAPANVPVHSDRALLPLTDPV
jgi:hypothetical protein